jgi:hypothetical protein
MRAARYSFPATLLQNGQVLVAGGNAATGGLLAEAEVYTPPPANGQPPAA